MTTSPDQSAPIVAALAAGFGLAVIGLVNLLLTGRSIRAACTLLVSGLVVGGVSLLPGPRATVWTAAAILAAGLVVPLAVGSDHVYALAARLAGVVRRPAVRWGLLAAVGAGVAVVGMLRFNAQQEAKLDEDTLSLEQLVIGVPTEMGEKLFAASDRGSPIPVGRPAQPRPGEQSNATEENYLRNSPHARHLIRREPPDDNANCHGWVFTGGRYLVASHRVEEILAENGYQCVPLPRPGDLIVYRGKAGEITHTGVVRYVTDGMPVLVEGKWGALGVFLHPADQSCYGMNYTYHRSARTGHILAGLDMSYPGRGG